MLVLVWETVWLLLLRHTRCSVPRCERKQSQPDWYTPEVITDVCLRLYNKAIEEILNVFPYQFHNDQQQRWR